MAIARHPLTPRPFPIPITYTQTGLLDERGLPRHPNEDCIAASTTIAVIADGFTGVVPGKVPTAEPTESAWFARELTTRVCAAAGTYPRGGGQHSQRQMLRDIIREVAASETGQAIMQAATDAGETMRVAGLPEELAHQAYASRIPAASIAWVEWTEDEVIVASLGTCTIALRTQDPMGGTHMRVINNPIPTTLDDAAILEMMKKAYENSRPVCDGPELIEDVLIENRAALVDQPAFCAATLNEASADFLEIMSFPRAIVRDVLLLTAGYAFADVIDICSDWSGFIQDASEDITRIARELRAQLDEDASFSKYPRLRHCDDMTAAYVELAD